MAIYDNPLEFELGGSGINLTAEFKKLEFIEQIQKAFEDCKPKPITKEEYMRTTDKILLEKLKNEKLTYQGRIKNGYIQRCRRIIERHYRSNLSSTDVERICNES